MRTRHHRVSVATASDFLTHYFVSAMGMCMMFGGSAIVELSGGLLYPAVSLGIATKALVL